MTRSQETTQHDTPHATLAAIGVKIRSLKLFDTIREHVFIKQKTIRHSPVEKLNDAFIAILSGAHGLCRDQHAPALGRVFATRLWSEVLR
jgi:hypothetical protein